MSRRIKILLIIVAIIIALAVTIAAVITIAGRNQKAVTEAVIEDFDLSMVPDGTFTGKYNAFPVIVEVEVTVRDHIMTAIDLIKHMNGQGEAAEALPGKVVETQSLTVDTISGATYSSKVILLAIQDALQSAAGE